MGKRRGNWRQACAVLCVAIILVASARQSAGDESLADMRGEVRTPPDQERPQLHLGPGGDPRPVDDPEYSDAERLGDGLEDAKDELVATACFYAVIAGVVAPYYCPYKCLGDSFCEPGYFAHYPYQYDFGYMLIDPVEALGMPGPCDPQWCATRVRGEFGTGLDDIDWIGGRVQFDTRWRLGIESDFRYVLENADARRDSLWLGDANVLFRFAQSEFVQFRTGLGFNFLSDTIGSDFGFNFTYTVDCQPVRPLLFTAELDLGTLGSASVVHVRTTAGIAWRFSEAYVGYDLYDVGSTQVQGLVAGIQIWY